MGQNIRKGDQVVILTGKDKGKTGKVIASQPKDHTVIVEGRNMVTKHQRPQRTTRATPQTQTGRIQKPAPMDVSKVMLICPRCDKPTRVSHGVDENNNTVRACKKCSELIDAS